MANQSSFRVGGAIFGAWLALVYAFVADWINRAFLPGIPLAEPEGGVFGYLITSIFIGVLIGFITCWPHNTWIGSLLGGMAGAAIVFISPWRQALGSPEQTIGTLFLTLYTFMPLMVLLIPAAFLIRFSVSHFPARRQDMLNSRQVIVPVLASLFAVVLGTFALHPEEVRFGFQTTHQLIQQGMKAGSRNIPEKLQSVQGFFPNANGRYTLEYSQDVEAYMGPRPVTTRLNSDFLIVATFDNGFSFACVTAPGLKEPASCANWP